jgi:hypothetical protein
VVLLQDKAEYQESFLASSCQESEEASPESFLAWVEGIHEVDILASCEEAGSYPVETALQAPGILQASAEI